jgi:hypothetical protein
LAPDAHLARESASDAGREDEALEAACRIEVAGSGFVYHSEQAVF